MEETRDERRTRRRPLDVFGAVAVDGRMLFKCRLADVSEGGARLDVGDETVPDRFQLIDIENCVVYSARTIWRRGSSAGVSFLHVRPADGPDTPEWIASLWRDLRGALGRPAAA
jgi:hypothetical protein